MLKYFLIPLGIMFSVFAQILLKKTTAFSYKEFSFYLFFCLAGLSYLFSFFLYSIILKYFPLSRISPVMTLGTLIFVIFAGIFLFHESFTLKHFIGISLGIGSIILINS